MCCNVGPLFSFISILEERRKDFLSSTFLYDVTRVCACFLDGSNQKKDAKSLLYPSGNIFFSVEAFLVSAFLECNA